MKARRHLFLALTRAGWGETALGIRVAQQLQHTGEEPFFLVHEAAGMLFRNGTIPFEEYSDKVGPFFEFLLDEQVTLQKPASIILCDFLTTVDNLRLMGLSPDILSRYGIPIIAMDTWNFEESGTGVDIFIGKTKPVSNWIAELPFRLAPVPFVRPQAKGACSFLPAPVRLPQRIREHVRAGFGLSAHDRAVLICTANWQQTLYNDDNGQRMAGAVPPLLGRYLAEFGPSVHVIHIGPTAFAFEGSLGERYHWMPSQTSERFQHVLGSVDLYLSLNVSATTMSTAIASGIPVVVVQNSCAAQNVDEACAWATFPLSDRVRTWLEQTTPLYPFSMFPLGFFRFLAPVLVDNPYCQAFHTVELLDEEGCKSTCNALLFDRGAREALLQAQAQYTALVHKLPTAANLVQSYLERGACSPR